MAATTPRARSFPPAVPKAAPEKVELLTVENHPTEGQRQRWRMSDGTVQDFHFTPTLVEAK